MAVLPGFIDHCTELLATLGDVRSKRMFGGVGLYAEGLFVAILAGDTLYLKTDDETRARFEHAGGQPFEFESRGKVQRTSYWAPPADAMDSPARMRPWAQLAQQAAVRAQAKPGRARKRKAA